MIKLIHISTIPQSLKFVSGQVGYMKAQGFEVHAIASYNWRLPAFGEREGIAVHSVEMKRQITPLHDSVAILKLWRLLRRLRPQIVHAHTPKGGLLGMVSSWLARVPVRVYQIHGLPLMTATGRKRILLLWGERVACRLAHQVLCVSHSVRQVAIEEGLCPPGKIKVLHNGSINGVDAMGWFNPDSVGPDGKREMREKYGIPLDAEVVGFLGRVVRDKGIVELVEVWKALREEFPNLHLLVAGPFEEQDPVPAEVEQALRNDPRIHLFGEVDFDHTPVLYAGVDIMVLPTYREGFPIVPLEAAAMGVPVVATQVPGCVDAVQDGVTGTLVPPYQPDRLAEAIRNYLNDPALRWRHGRAGRERALRDFRQEAVWEAIYQEYERLLQKKQLPVPARLPGEGDKLSRSKAGAEV